MAKIEFLALSAAVIQCGFAAKNELGVKIHIGRAHRAEVKVLDIDPVQVKAPIFSICQLCNLKLEDEDKLNEHINAKHVKSIILEQQQAEKCPTCLVEFVDKNKLDIHINSAHKMSTYDCKDCAQVFDNSELLDNHITTHRKWNIDRTPAVKYRCEHSNYKSSITKQIKKRMEEQHGASYTKVNYVPLLMPKNSENILGKRKGNRE